MCSTKTRVKAVNICQGHSQDSTVQESSEKRQRKPLTTLLSSLNQPAALQSRTCLQNTTRTNGLCYLKEDTPSSAETTFREHRARKSPTGSRLRRTLPGSPVQSRTDLHFLQPSCLQASWERRCSRRRFELSDTERAPRSPAQPGPLWELFLDKYVRNSAYLLLVQIRNEAREIDEHLCVML